MKTLRAIWAELCGDHFADIAARREDRSGGTA